MSTLRVSEIRNASSATGGLSIAADGVVSGALPSPNRNLLYNGAMQVAQRGTSVTGITDFSGTSAYQTVDRHRVYSGATIGTWTQSVENDAPTGSGLRKSLKMLCTSANSSLDASDLLYVGQALEGQDLQRIAKGTASAKKLTLSFWVKTNVTGTYVIWLRDNDNSRSVNGTYSIAAGDSGNWVKRTITFPADTTGAFDNDNAESLRVSWWLMAGSNFTSGTLPTASWEATTTANIAAGQTANVSASTNNYWQITGVQLEVGDTATEFEFKSYGQELAECQRYYYLAASGSLIAFATGSYYSSSQLNVAISFPVTMRAAPNAVISSGTNYYDFERNSGNDNFNSLTLDKANQNSCRLYNVSEMSGTAGQAGYVQTNNAAASVAFIAEL